MNIVTQTIKKLKRAKRIFAIFIPVFFLSGCKECLTVQDYTSEGIGNNCSLCKIFDILTIWRV